jgi:hypothetical protein
MSTDARSAQQFMMRYSSNLASSRRAMDGEGMNMIHAIYKLARTAAGAVAVLLVPLFCGFTGIAPAQAQTLTHARLSAQDVDTAVRSKLSGAAPLVARYGTDQGVLGSSETLLGMKLVLHRGVAEQAALDDYLAQLQNPASPNYHKWLTPEAFGQRFGSSDEDIAAVTAWLQQQGLSVDGVSRSRTVITFSGTEAQFNSAFHAEMHRYVINGETRIANAATPSVPTALAPAIVGIATLGNAKFTPLHTKAVKALRGTNGQWRVQDTSAVKTQAANTVKSQFTENLSGSYYLLVGPSDFAAMYGVKSVWDQGYTGSGQSIAIVAESNITKSDVDSFRKAFGLSDTNLKVTVLGDDPGLQYSAGYEGEAVLDVEWAGATAPDADINLVVAASTSTDEGIIIAAEYAIDNNISPILNLSWGACELGLQTSGNQYFEDLWAQAAAQGISVVVASGDGDATACDQSEYYASYGQQVNGMASPSNAIAVGGTDFPVNADNLSSYWSKSNDATTLQSVKSYVPESIWNDSCASPDVLSHASDFGLSETTSAKICNNEYSFLNTVGGGGGISLCTTSDGSSQSTCTGGYDAPAWQQSITSIGVSGKRHVPDVSFFAGAGLWASAYAFCEADASADSGDSGDCINNDGVMTSLAAGGTSFAAPAFAGVIALLNQQQGTRQGNINKYLYALGEKQFADSTLSTTCQSADGNSTEGCIFHDVIQGSNAAPCVLNSLLDPSSGTTCSKEGTYDWVGVAAGYSAGVGYDAASGLGSVNVTNLLANWNSAVSLDTASVTTHNLTSATSLTYGTVASASVDVKAATGTGTPTGSIAMLSLESDDSTLAVASGALSSGDAVVSFSSLTPGTHHIYASYGGDAHFGASSSTPTKLTITQAATTLTASASNAKVTAPNAVTILAEVQTDSFALNPTGTVVFTNHATGTVLGTTTLTSYTGSSGASWAMASMRLAGTALSSGDNVIDISYAGDSNYLAASATSVTVDYVSAYAVSSSISSLDIDVSGSKQASATITIASGNGVTIKPASLLLACQGLTVSGVNCAFTAPVLDSAGAATSTLTVTVSDPQTTQTAARTASPRMHANGAGLLSLAGLLLLWGRIARKKISHLFGVLLLAVSLVAGGVLSGCGNSSHATTSTAITNTLLVSSSSPSYGTAVTLTSMLSPVSNTATPSGTVLFYDGATLLGSAQVSSGKAQLSVSKLAVGKHTITASYSGDTTFMPSTSNTASVSVSLATTLNISVSDTSGNLTQLALPVTIH